MVLNFGRTTIISVTYNTINMNSNYKLCNVISCAPKVLKIFEFCLTAISVIINKVIIYFSWLKRFEFYSVRLIFSFVAADSFCILYTTLVQSKLEYAYVFWNSLTLENWSKIQIIKINSATLYYFLCFCGHMLQKN
jgi:ABC-type Fe3+-siderophore transport system permease subunit